MNLAIFIYSLSLLLVCILLVVGGWYFWDAHQNRKPGRTVYVGSNLQRHLPLLQEIIQRYIVQRGEETQAYAWVEPGAGLGYVTRQMGKRYTWRTLQAIEVSPLIYLTGKVLTWFTPSLRWQRADVLSMTFPAPAVLYCYLFSEVTTRLYQQGSLQGCLVICLTFPIEGIKPTEVLPLTDWQKQLLVYDFRLPPEPETAG